jgi:hypothetical protein
MRPETEITTGSVERRVETQAEVESSDEVRRGGTQNVGFWR